MVKKGPFSSSFEWLFGLFNDTFWLKVCTAVRYYIKVEIGGCVQLYGVLILKKSQEIEWVYIDSECGAHTRIRTWNNSLEANQFSN